MSSGIINDSGFGVKKLAYYEENTTPSGFIDRRYKPIILQSFQPFGLLVVGMSFPASRQNPEGMR
jgi:hypothetical protein